MGLKAALSKPFANIVVNRLRKSATSGKDQSKWFRRLISIGKETAFGRAHHFETIESYVDYKNAVPIMDYESTKPYIERALDGERNVLWPGRPSYWSKTSGTTSGIKYIPITKASLPHHIKAARNALLCYIAETGKADFVDRKMIFLQGSPKLNRKKGVWVGRLSGIVAHHVPNYLRKNQMPSLATNSIEDWEKKVAAIVEETMNEDLSLISGIPSWVQMYFEKLLAQTGKDNIKQVFPNFSLLVYGGVNFDPYKAYFSELIGGKVDAVEVYPASEGFIAFQDRYDKPGLLLLTNAGIFYEFVPLEEYHLSSPKRLRLEEVELGVNYAIILTTNAGLWSYSLGDTVKFIEKNPYRLLVTGRVKHFISAFGEHVIAEEVEGALEMACREHGAQVAEFTVAPQVSPAAKELPYHEWLIEFVKKPEDLKKFAAKLNLLMQEKNIYYNDLLQGKVLQVLKVTLIQRGGFASYMKSLGKLGGQNKVPRLKNDRTVADQLRNWEIKESEQQAH